MILGLKDLRPSQQAFNGVNNVNGGLGGLGGRVNVGGISNVQNVQGIVNPGLVGNVNVVGGNVGVPVGSNGMGVPVGGVVGGTVSMPVGSNGVGLPGGGVVGGNINNTFVSNGVSMPVDGSVGLPVGGTVATVSGNGRVPSNPSINLVRYYFFRFFFGNFQVQTQIIQNLREKYKNKFPQNVDTSQTQITEILEMPKQEGEIKRDKLGRRIIREETKSVQIIEPDPPQEESKPKQDAESSKNIPLKSFSIKNI